MNRTYAELIGVYIGAVPDKPLHDAVSQMSAATVSERTKLYEA